MWSGLLGEVKAMGVCDVVGLGLDGTTEVLGGERVGVSGGVRVGEVLGLNGDWRGDCWGESCVEV